ncbi:DNA polymerase III subunit delta' [Tindallia californiensis]|uniref:DNA polymerase III, delta prime subunit n=1 Tax=Tindallia californiensis TaxID=159292 RepID=A0A1H3PIY6_9FIRM|nr:DNA polymerase III subunit delta' [Tindallia californiensis]SDZ00775.1 DNA polymerase III, delta prime subunit [Tindallia californiensis]
MSISLTQTIGQEPIKQVLSRALENGKLSHGYLFEGPAGLGKRKMAKELAAVLLCRQEKKPCGECNDCRQVAAETHAEFRWIRSEEEGKEPVVTVEMIRNLVKDIYLKPYESDHKVYVLPEADTMTLQAQNALLKTLEEPPEHSLLILVTPAPERLLPTIRSRCQRLVFRPVERQVLEHYLVKEKQMAPEKAAPLAAFANGIPERAVEMLENETYQEEYKAFVQLTDSILEKSYGLAIEKGSFMQQEKSQALWALDFWQEWLRDLQILLIGGSEDLLVHQHQKHRLQKQVAGYTRASLQTAQLLMETSREDIRLHGNLAFIVETLLINMVRLVKEPSYSHELSKMLATDTTAK